MEADKGFKHVKKLWKIYLNKTGFVVFSIYDDFRAKERRYHMWMQKNAERRFCISSV